MTSIIGAKIHINGVVQGVGFRPFVYNLAKKLGIQGWVRNTSAGVDIEADATKETLDHFINALKNEAPPLARIDDITVEYSTANGHQDFTIIPSTPIPHAFQPISPDVSICDDCLRELFSPDDRRYRYPFINCTNCGPRFTIIKDIPYDRPNTTMANFPLCDDCAQEYHDPTNRRFHAQPVACPVCGPHIWLEIQGQEVEKQDNALSLARDMIKQGKILAIKGLGGFHLACDATNQQAVVTLRQRKLRVDKPFALMFPDIQTVENHCFVSPSERNLLSSRERPIVLLYRKPESNIVAEVAPQQKTLGVMLPYTPLHYLLMEQSDDFPPALVMTSGNISEEPIATDNEEARHRLSSLADAFLMHNRDIYVRCDDSVLRTISFANLSSPVSDMSPIYPIRRSRGYAPYPVKLPENAPPLLAVGGELKNTFCLTNQDYAFLSQHIGDMENYETYLSFTQGIDHFERLFRVKPEVIASDMHPDYLSSRYAEERAQNEELSLIRVQHHHAHIASCMAENRISLEDTVIGLACDGTGYGDDGAIWGGEIILTRYDQYERLGHLTYFPLPGGDQAIRNPARIALALLWSINLPWDERLAPVQHLCASDRTTIKLQLEKQINTIPTSSMGRLFDAVAALCGLRQTINYEAQAAIELENYADPAESGYYPFFWKAMRLHFNEAIEQIIQDILAGVPVSTISARFHNGLARGLYQAVKQIHKSTGVNKIVLSGGVWQNITLLERTLTLLNKDDFIVYIHKEVPTNDGGISLGQAMVGASKVLRS